MTILIATCRARCMWNKLLPRVSMVTQIAHRQQSNMSLKFPGYKTIYRFNYIRTAGAVNFLKLYATAVAGVSLPSIAAFSIVDIFSMDTVYNVGCCEIALLLPLYAVGFLCHKLIVFVYLSEDNEKVKISYVDFWGSRVDIDTDITDICQISDLPSTKMDALYLTMQRYSNKDTLKLNISLGTIVDDENFQTVFGDTSR